MATIKVQTSDDKIVEIELELAKHLRPVQQLLEALPDFDEKEIMNLDKVSSHVLKKVLEWLAYHKDDPQLERMDDDDDDDDDGLGAVQSDNIPQWDANFLKVEQTILLQMLEAASYLSLKGLVEVTSKTVANMIKGKTPAQIRETFFITDPYATD